MWPKATQAKTNNVMDVSMSFTNFPQHVTNTNWVPNQENSRISLQHNYVGKPDTNLYRETKSGGLYHPKRFQ
jgi:hypothetical protein